MLAFGSGYDHCNQLFVVPDSEAKDSNLISTLQNLDINLSNISDISFGNTHSAYVTLDGKAYAIGDDRYYYIGSKSAVCHHKPVEITFPFYVDHDRFISLQCGKDYTLYLTKSGTIFLCSAVLSKTREPAVIREIPSPRHFARTWDIPLVITEKKQMYIIKQTQRSPRAKRFKKSLSDVKDVCHIQNSLGNQSVVHTFLVLLCDRRVFANGFLNENKEEFVQIHFSNDEKIIKIRNGFTHFLALSESGVVYSCGINENGELGLSDTTNYFHFYPILSMRHQFIISIEAGFFHSVFLSKDGVVLTCGINYYGQLMHPQSNRQDSCLIPTEVILSGPFSHVLCGANSTIIFKNWFPSSGPGAKASDINELLSQKAKISQTLVSLDTNIQKTQKKITAYREYLNQLLPKNAAKLDEQCRLENDLKRKHKKLINIRSELKRRMRLEESVAKYDPCQSVIIDNFDLGDFQFIDNIAADKSLAKFFHIPTRNFSTMKTLNVSFISDEVYQKFIKDIELLRGLKHMCIANIFGYCISNSCNSQPTIVFEFLPETLYDAIHLKKVGNIRKCVIILEIVMGMRYVHSANIIHRNLHPKNIMLTPTYHAKIWNFELAAVLDLDKSLTVNVGDNIEFRAPEILSRGYSFPVDVYSFGLIAYFILADGIVPNLLHKGKSHDDWIAPLEAQQFMKDIIKRCWQDTDRPTFAEIYEILKKNDFKIIKDVDKTFAIERAQQIEIFEQAVCFNDDEEEEEEEEDLYEEEEN